MVDGLTAEEALASWSQRLDPDSGVSVFGAEVEGAIVGFISVKSSDEPTGDFDGMIDTLYIVQAGQGLGLGRGQMCPEVLLSWPLPLTLPNK